MQQMEATPAQAELHALIPESKLEAVQKALQSAFGVTMVDCITPLSGGLSSAVVYKIVVTGKSYVLRIIMNVNELADPARHFACMTLAAAAGIAPKVYYTNVEDALSIVEFVPTVPLIANFADKEALLLELVRVVKTIHAAPLFPKLVNFLDGVDILIANFKGLNMLPESATVEVFELYAQIQQYYPRHDPDVVSSHNDLNYNNILFDGKQIWIVDWEAAFPNDRYADLASLGNFFVANQTQEEFYLRAYFGDSLDAYKRARYFLMQQVRHIFYGVIMMRVAADSKPAGWRFDDNMQAPSAADFRAMLRTGEVQLGSAEGQLLFAKVELNEALQNMRSQRFADSIALMSAGA